MVPATPPRLRAFGGVAARGPSGPVDLGGPKQQAVLAALLLDPGGVVPIHRLVEVLWGDDPPGRAEASIRGYVSNLRKALIVAGVGADATVVQFRDGGYVLAVAPEGVDLHCFEHAVRDGLAAHDSGDHPRSRARLVEALAYWTGPPFGLAAEDLAFADAVAGLGQRRAEAVEALADARLALGDHAGLVADLVGEIAAEPYREGLRALLARALAATGRRVEALRSLGDARRVLAEDIGVPPGPELRAVEAAILADDQEPTVPPPGAGTVHGRHHEQGLLASALSTLVDGAATGGGGGVVVISGEAGIGKTTLARGLLADAVARGIPTGHGRGSESAIASPYRSWATAVRRLVAAGAPETIEHDLRDATDPGGGPISARLARHDRVVAALAACETAMVVLIDDLQWVDDATLAVLEHLAAELDELPLLLVVTVRRGEGGRLPGPVHECLAELARSPRAVQVPLAGLTRAEVGGWVRAALGVPNEVVTDLLVDTTAGNPFYVSELLALIDAEGRLEPGRAPDLRVPAAVQDVVRRRMSRLPPETQSLLAVAAVIGRRFDADVLAVVADRDPGAVLDALVPAVDAALIGVEDAGAGRFVFSHALVAETLIAEQNAAALARLHARTTSAIESRRATHLDQWLEALAHHSWFGAAAGTADEALHYNLRAADIAGGAQAAADVAEHLGRALAALELTGADDPVQRIELLARRGVALRDSGDVSGGRAALVDAALLAESIGDDAAVASTLSALHSDDLWAGMDWSLFEPRVVALIERVLDRSDPRPTAARISLSSTLAGELVYLDPARSAQLSTGAAVDAEALGDPLLLARTMLQRYWALSGPSGVVERARISDRLIELAEAGDLPSPLVPLSHLARVSAAYETGDRDTVERCRLAARVTAHPVRTPIAWAHLQYLEASLALAEGDLERASVGADAVGEAMWRARRFAAGTTRAGLLSVIRAEQGRVDEALAEISVIEAAPYSEPIRWLKAWVLAEGGREDEAAQALASFDGPLADDWLWVPLTVAGVLAAARIGDDAFLGRHLASLDPVGDRFACVGGGGLVLGPVAFALALGSARLGGREQALAHLDTARDLTMRMGAVRWHARIDGLAATLGGG